MVSGSYFGWLAALALFAPLPVFAAPLPPPSLANDCGRGAEAFLAPIAASHVAIQIPMSPHKYFSQPVGFGNGLQAQQEMYFEEQGAIRLRILVDKYGKAAEVTVTDSSAPPEMEKAVADAVRTYYRWEPPPPECRDSGVIVSIAYLNTWAVPQLQIYNGDPRYPTAAHEHKMGAAGVAQMSFKGPNKVWNARVLISMGSPALDDSMVKTAKDLVTDAIKNRDDRHSITGNFAVMFMPDYLSAPPPSNGTSMVVPAFTNIPGLPLDPP